MSEGPTSTLWTWLVKGVAVTVPLVITLMILIFVLGMLSPVVGAVELLWPDSSPPTVFIQLTTLASLIGLFLLAGFVAGRTPGSSTASAFHSRMEAVPLIGSLYTSVHQASDVLFRDENDQFQDVKLVEFPHQDAYMLGFLTAETPPEIRDGADVEEMRTVMVPLGPNPTTNGYRLARPGRPRPRRRSDRGGRVSRHRHARRRRGPRRVVVSRRDGRVEGRSRSTSSTVDRPAGRGASNRSGVSDVPRSTERACSPFDGEQRGLTVETPTEPRTELDPPTVRAVVTS